VPVFALALELPEETFVDMHKMEEVDDSWFRCECRQPEREERRLLIENRYGLL